MTTCFIILNVFSQVFGDKIYDETVILSHVVDLSQSSVTLSGAKVFTLKRPIIAIVCYLRGQLLWVIIIWDLMNRTPITLHFCLILHFPPTSPGLTGGSEVTEIRRWSRLVIVWEERRPSQRIHSVRLGSDNLVINWMRTERQRWKIKTTARTYKQIFSFLRHRRSLHSCLFSPFVS